MIINGIKFDFSTLNANDVDRMLAAQTRQQERARAEGSRYTPKSDYPAWLRFQCRIFMDYLDEVLGEGASEKLGLDGSNFNACLTVSKTFAEAMAAEKAQKAAEDAAELAGTRAGTDKTLNTENAPADAAAVGKAFASIIKAYDIALAAASWKATSDTAAKNAGWAYQCDATVSGCTAALEPSATISLESVVVAQKAGLGSICSTDVGFCRFYAEKVPTADISLRLLLTNKNPV